MTTKFRWYEIANAAGNMKFPAWRFGDELPDEAAGALQALVDRHRLAGEGGKHDYTVTLYLAGWIGGDSVCAS